MRARWHALHANLVRSSSRLGFQSDFDTLRQRHAELSRFRDPAQLLDGLHAPDGDPVLRNAILAALVRSAQASEQTALVLVMLALWPGLDAVHRRLIRHFRAEPEALVSGISERITRGVRTLDLCRVNRVAATLIRNVERDIRRDLGATWAEAKRQTLATDLQSVPIRSLLDLPDGLDAEVATRRIAEQLRQWIGADAVLVLAVAVLGLRQHEAAARLGLAPEAARKRYQRALRRLRGILEDFV